MKKILLAVLSVLILTLGSGLTAQSAYASSTSDAAGQVCTGVSGQAGGTCGTGGVDISTVLKGVLNILSVIAGIAAVIMIVVTGLRYITSGGEAQAVSGAKRSLIYAIVGLLVVASAQLLVHFVLART